MEKNLDIRIYIRINTRLPGNRENGEVLRDVSVTHWFASTFYTCILFYAMRKRALSLSPSLLATRTSTALFFSLFVFFSACEQQRFLSLSISVGSLRQSTVTPSPTHSHRIYIHMHVHECVCLLTYSLCKYTHMTERCVLAYLGIFD